MRTALTRLLVITTTGLALTACGGEDTPAADETPTPPASSSAATEQSPSESATAEEPAPDENVIEITIEGDQITPNGDRVEVPLGQPVTFDITSDRAGELHVHSTPEQELAYADGETQVKATFDKPGIVEVEDHESDKVVVQLQVS
ncbi:MAG: hypothetical protein ACTHKG_06995 [Nocardioides sp.]